MISGVQPIGDWFAHSFWLNACGKYLVGGTVAMSSVLVGKRSEERSGLGLDKGHCVS